MNKIPLKYALDILHSSVAIIVDTDLVTYASFNHEDDEDEFMTVLDERDCNENEIIFLKSNNEKVEIYDTYMILKDEKGEDYEIAILKTQKLF
jgi:hypothetical protein